MRLLTDSFDIESLDQWSSASGVITGVVSSNIGGGDFAAQVSGGGGTLSKTLPSTYSELFWGFFALFEITIGDANKRIIEWRKGATVLGSLRFNTGNRKIEAYIGDSTLVSTGTFVWNDNESHHLQIRVKIADSEGVIQVKVNDLLDVDFSGDTKPGADTTIDGFGFIGNSFESIYAAITVNDTSGTEDNSWPGVVRMRGRVPDEDGFYNDFDRDPASPTTAFSHLDESGPPNSTDLVSTDVNAERQSLRFPSHGLVRAQVKAVNYVYQMRIISGGQAKHGIRRVSDGAEVFDASPRTPSTSFDTEVFRYTKNPLTNAAWTLEEAQDDKHESVMEAVI